MLMQPEQTAPVYGPQLGTVTLQEVPTGAIGVVIVVSVKL